MAPKQEPEYINHDKFLSARDRIIGKKHNDRGIGTLSEKTVHAILKNYYEPDQDNHEVALEGYVADIYNDNGIMEIQTGNFNKMREKLSVFLNLYPVTIIYPMPCDKWVSWIDEQTGVVSKKRKSPKRWNCYYAFYEMYKIKEFLNNPNIRFKIVLLDMEEYRLLNGWNDTKKRGSTRYDRIPLGIREEITIEQIEDYIQFVPFDIEGGFKSSDFAKYAGIDIDTARQVLHILNHVGAVRRTGKTGNAHIYEIREEYL